MPIHNEKGKESIGAGQAEQAFLNRSELNIGKAESEWSKNLGEDQLQGAI